VAKPIVLKSVHLRHSKYCLSFNSFLPDIHNRPFNKIESNKAATGKQRILWMHLKSSRLVKLAAKFNVNG